MTTSGQGLKNASIFRGINDASGTVCILFTAYGLPFFHLTSPFFLLPFCDPGANLRQPVRHLLGGRRMRLRRRTLAYVTPARFERAAYSLEGCCSIQLSYGVFEISSFSAFLLFPISPEIQKTMMHGKILVRFYTSSYPLVLACVSKW